MDAYDDENAEPEKLEDRKPYDNKLLPESSLPDGPCPDENDPNAPRPLKITDKEVIIGVPEPPEWSWDPEIQGQPPEAANDMERPMSEYVDPELSSLSAPTARNS